MHTVLCIYTNEAIPTNIKNIRKQTQNLSNFRKQILVRLFFSFATKKNVNFPYFSLYTCTELRRHLNHDFFVDSIIKSFTARAARKMI